MQKVELGDTHTDAHTRQAFSLNGSHRRIQMFLRYFLPHLCWDLLPKLLTQNQMSLVQSLVNGLHSF